MHRSTSLCEYPRLRQVRHRVNGNAVLSHFIVQMKSRDIARLSHFTYHLTASHPVALADSYLGQMGIPCLIAFPMANFHESPVTAAVRSRLDNITRRCSNDFRALGRSNIHSGVESGPPACMSPAIAEP